VGLGAVVVLTMKTETGVYAGKNGQQETLVAQPLSCVDVMGRPMVERTVQHLLDVGVGKVTLLTSKDIFRNRLPLANRLDKVEVKVVDDPCSAVNHVLSHYFEGGIEHAFVFAENVYAETDLLDFAYFHREAKKGITRAFDHEGPLDLWAVDCGEYSRFDLERMGASDGDAASYFIAGYVRRLLHPGDLRAIIADSLGGVCAMRPSGQEVRPGIWLDEDAEIDRRARIVAPAYIGCNSKVRADALVTRCSSIERDCCIDFGTIVEDSSILANTRVGIWLDVRHAVASGNKLMSLKHDVLLKIADPNVMRFNSMLAKEENNNSSETPERIVQPIVSKIQPDTAPERWQLGANLIQG
jgi:NDP-sugar pyrophosphorylase family protein